MYNCLVTAVVKQQFRNYVFRDESAAWLIREDDVVIVSWNFMI